MIVLEGPDGAGKSTLKRQLIEEFPDLREGTRGTNDRNKLYTVTVPDTFRALCLAVTGNDPPLVWDRLFFSEFVYPAYMGNRPCQFSEAQRLHILALLRALKCPVIWCMPPQEIVVANAAKAPQMKGVDENIASIYDDYAQMFLWTPPSAIVYDYTKDHPSRVFEVFKNYNEERTRRSW